MAKGGSKNGAKTPFTEKGLRKYFSSDVATLAIHVDQLRRKRGWRNVKEWARGDFLSWYAAIASPSLKFQKICPASFPEANRFGGFELEDFCFIFEVLGIVDQEVFNKYRYLFDPLKKEKSNFYYKVIRKCIPELDFAQEFLRLKYLSVEDLKKYCVFTETDEFSKLEEKFPLGSKTLKECGWNRKWFWDAVLILLRRKTLPPNFNPIESVLLLSHADLEELGYVHNGPIDI